LPPGERQVRRAEALLAGVFGAIFLALSIFVTVEIFVAFVV